MKEILTKKLLIIVSVVTFIVLGAVVLSLTAGRTYYPSLSDPDGIFYQRVDDQGNVIYTITNQEIFEEIKSNDGIQQLLYMTDSVLLSEYIDQVTQDEIDEKILELTYGTSDPDELAKLDDDTKEKYEIAFQQSMILAGFQNNEGEYARLIVAREKYATEQAVLDELITEKNVALEYLNNYWGDVSAIKIRFTSTEDAKFVMQKFNLVSLAGIDLREYNGYVYKQESLLDSEENIVQAYITIDVYYFDSENQDILDSDGDVAYEYGVNGLYSDGTNQFNLVDGNLLNGLGEVVISTDVLFDNSEDALAYKEENTTYYSVTRTDPYNMDETIEVRDETEAVVFTIDPDGHIWNTLAEDVTYTTDLYVNKVYTSIDKVVTVTSNNSSSLTEEQVLAKYIEMYNYVYSLYRDELPTNLTAQQLAATDDEYLAFNYLDEKDLNPTLATYMFDTLSIADSERYSQTPKAIASGVDTYYYMIFKLTEVPKEDFMSKIFDYLIPLVVIPTSIGATIELPTTTYYGGTIGWSSSNTAVISSLGTVNVPDTDTEVTLTFSMTVLGKSESHSITVTVLANGETDSVTVPEWEEISLKTLINDPTAYNILFNRLLDDYITGSNGETNIDTILIATRQELGLKIYDHYLGLDYQAIDKTFITEKSGDKLILATYESTLTSDEPLQITADQFLEFALTKNAALYTLYASQFKELLYSTYYTEVFGDQKDLMKNNTPAMDEMYTSITNVKEYYAYLGQLYAQYGMTFGYATFSDYIYAQYGTKTELGLMEYFVSGKIQPYFINETVVATDVVDALYPIVQDYYDNYFSLDVTHLLIYLDFDEDGSPDDYYEYKDSLTPEQLDAFNILQAGLEIAIDEYEGTFAELISEYNKASREDETWGIYKQNGFFILTEDLNTVDDNDVSHSLTYSGTYGVKDTFVEEYVTALINLYQEYQLDQNLSKSEIYSGLVETKFGLHVIEASKGDDFEQPTCDFTETDPDNPLYSDGSENANEAPTLEQMQLYALYKFYSMVYDLTDADIEATYGITVPKLPTSVKSALDFYLGDLLDGLYVLGTINVDMSGRLESGEFVSNIYTTATNAELMAMLADVGTVYFDAIFSEYITE